MNRPLPFTFFLFALFFLACPSFAADKEGLIKGKVFTSDGQPAAAVTVELKGLSRSTLTSEDGSFIFRRLAAGNYTIVVSLTGHTTEEQVIQLTDGGVGELKFTLSASAGELKEVVIRAGVNRFADKESDEVARLPLKNMENPQVYSVVGQSLIREQMSVERTDLYRNIPGAVPNFSSGGSQGMTLRGFMNSMGMRNGLITSAIVPLNPAILERVEILKGPSATLFGSNRNISFGGVYNYITKRPYNSNGGEINVSAGSFKLARISADVNTPVNQDKTALLRVIIAGQTEGSFQDQGYAKNYTVAASFSYQASDKLTFIIDGEVTRSAYTSVSLAFGNLAKITARNFKDLPLAYDRSFINNSVDIHNGINNLQARMEYSFLPGWKSQTNVLFSEGFYQSLLWPTLTLLTDSTISRSVRNQTPETFGNIQLQQNFIGDFQLGRLRSRLVIGLDYSHNYNNLYRVTLNFDTISIHKTVADMSAAKLEQLSATKGFTASSTSSNTYSIYASDVLDITPSLMAMLSLRADRYTTEGTLSPSTGVYTGSYNQNSLSPKFGLVYQIIRERLSLFGNYMNGFVNLGPVTQPDGTIFTLKPQKGDQWEAGIKTDLLGHALTGTLSYYDISVTNSTRTETINGQVFTLQDGTQKSKGFEAEVITTPLKGLNIVAGYAYNENKYRKASQLLQGKFLTFSPQHMGNIWVSYRLPDGAARGLGLGIGGNYVGDCWFESSNTMKLPAYTLLNAALFYETGKYRLSVKANNLLNEKYWNNNGTPQKQLNFLAGVAFKW